MESPRVLICDDDPVLLDLMVRRIVRLGHKADSASDGRAALVMLKRARYDLVVTDIYMPGASGLDVLAEARARDPNLQVIVITAAATLDNAVQALNSGAFSYLTKPFDHLSVFDTAVSRALEYRRLTLDNQRMAEIQRRRGDMLEAEVTDRIQQLRRSQRELLDLLALLPAGIMVLSAEGRIVLTNPAAERWLAREYRAKQRPIQSYIRQIVKGEANSAQTVTLEGHTLTLNALDLPGEDERKRVAIMVQDGARAAIQPDPGVPTCVSNMKPVLASLYRAIGGGPGAQQVKALAVLVAKMDKASSAASAVTQEVPQAAPPPPEYAPAMATAEAEKLGLAAAMPSQAEPQAAPIAAPPSNAVEPTMISRKLPVGNRRRLEAQPAPGPNVRTDPEDPIRYDLLPSGSTIEWADEAVDYELAHSPAPNEGHTG
jgi:DNA-binding response OmpR family regulator